MGDRSNPIKFGPEWLRNLAPEPRGSGRPGSSLSNQNIQSSPVAAGTASAAAVAGSSGGNTYANSPGPAGASACDTETIQQQKLNLSKLRYGREEMLALFDTSTEPPVELKNIELIYQARGKQPFALQNFDNGMRDNMRGGPSGNPFRGTSRSMTRGMNMGDGRGRPRAPFVRVPQAVRGGHNSYYGSSPRNSAYGGPDDESTLRPWTGSNGSPGVSRSTSEPAEWTPNKLFRSTRKGNNTNWRQTSRDEGDEWRSAEGARPRPTQQQDKWERDWGDRPTQEKHTWHTNRRPWGDQQNHEDNLPEWAMDNAEACGGTFDSSGAFHGYSNDDSNLPRPQETTYPLARSQTHGSFVRSKTVEEGSDEWWASEKAKKLSPKRFEAGDVKFKKGAGNNQDRSSSPALASHQSANGDDLQSPEQLASSPPPHDSSGNKQAKFADNKNYAMEETNDEPGNFQSVMINTNNGLRQKHQNIVASVGEAASGSKQSRKHGIVNVQRVQAENEQGRKQNQSNEKIHLAEEEEHLQKLPTTPSSSNAGVPMGMPQMVNAMAQMRFSPGIQNQVNLSNMGNNLPMGMPNMQNVGLQGLQVMSSMANMQQMQTNHPGLQGTMPQQAGMQSAMQGLQSNRQNTGLPSNLQNTGLHSNMQNSGLQTNMQSGGLPSNLQNSGLPSNMQNTGLPSNMQNTGLNSNMQNTGLASNMQSTGLPSNMQSPGLQNQGMTPTSQIQHMQNAAMQSNIQNSMQPNLQGLQNQMQSGMKHNQMQSSAMPGIANSTLNASLGLPIGPSNSSMSISHMQGMPQPMPNSGLSNQGLNSPMQGPGIPGFMGGGIMPGLGGGNAASNSLFMGQSNHNQSDISQILPNTDIPMPGQNRYPMHGLQTSNSQTSFGGSIYGNILPQTQVPANPNQNLADQWYYQDPTKIVQGPFSSKEMYSWYRAGFFSPSLMVRRACETHMRPLGTYGPVLPFAIGPPEIMPGFPISGGFEPRSQVPHDIMNIGGLSDSNPIESLQFGSVGMMRTPPFGQQQHMMESLWGQGASNTDALWMQQPVRNSQEEETEEQKKLQLNKLSMFFWDQEPSTLSSSPMRPEDMKTEDEILAQLRASQNIGAPQSTFSPETNQTIASKPEDSFPPNITATPNLEELHKLLDKDTLAGTPKAPKTSSENQETPVKFEKAKAEPTQESNAKSQQNTPSKTAAEPKPKSNKTDVDKTIKNKENAATKSKNKKSKEEKKEEVVESKNKEEDVAKIEKRSQESSPSKNKKEDKISKKELEKEKKEWLKDGFTIVKGAEKTTGKDKKSKAEEAKMIEEAEKKRKEEEKLAAEEEKKKRRGLEDAIKKQQEQQVQRQAAESAIKKAPWSAVNNPMSQSTNKEGPTLAEIQRLEREKKLEQIKEQQQMMQIIAQQQAAALAREQEMQAGLGWAKNTALNMNAGPSLAEIQAEARKQQQVASSVATVAQAVETQVIPPVVSAPWGNTHNGGGFWDTQPTPPKQPEKPVEPPKAAEPVKKKKAPVTPQKKASPSPAADFENWCASALTAWSSDIDVPTFVGFLKDIESPYEVKDYVKCYLGESKETSDFSRQFLERRSKLLRVGMVTPSDDLCSPAMAINPRTISGSDYQEVKGKAKKTKKNKMFKVDARILGFSVTAAEDRINVGDIDSV